jgi:hypothetical protein
MARDRRAQVVRVLGSNGVGLRIWHPVTGGSPERSSGGLGLAVALARRHASVAASSVCGVGTARTFTLSSTRRSIDRDRHSAQQADRG